MYVNIAQRTMKILNSMNRNKKGFIVDEKYNGFIARLNTQPRFSMGKRFVYSFKDGSKIVCTDTRQDEAPLTYSEYITK